jgi:hypothetical protein
MRIMNSTVNEIRAEMFLVKTKISLGRTIFDSRPAFCLMTGTDDDVALEKNRQVRIPTRRYWAKLGSRCRMLLKIKYRTMRSRSGLIRDQTSPR